MIRAAATAFLLFFSSAVALGSPSDRMAAPRTPAKPLFEDPTLAALQKEVARLADLIAAGPRLTPAQKDALTRSQASFRKTVAACGDAKPCLQRTLIERVFHLRQGYADARTKDSEGISLGPFIAACPGFDGLIAVTFVNSDPSFSFLAWRDKAVVLTQAAAASGARYAGPFGIGEAQFWNKGKDATLDLPGKPTLNCEMQEGG